MKDLTIEKVITSPFHVMLTITLFLGLQLSSQGITLTASDDSFVNLNQPNANKGNLEELRVVNPASGNDRQSFVRFDLSPIPPGSAVSRASIRLYVANLLNSGSVGIHVVVDPWDESTITPNLSPMIDPSVLTTITIATSEIGKFVEADVTSVVQDWLDGTQDNNGLAFLGTPADNIRVILDSKENTITSHPVELEVVLDNEDADADPANELNTGATLNGTDLELSDAGGTLSVDLSSLDDDTDADADPANELNTLVALNGTDLEVTDAGGTLTADLSSLSDDGDWTISGGDVVRMTGNVGIGIASPEDLLHIKKNHNGDTGLIIENTDGSNDATSEIRLRTNIDGDSTSGLILKAETNPKRAQIVSAGPVGVDMDFLTKGDFSFSATGDNPLGGNLGIGTISPSYKLDIAGQVLRIRDDSGTHIRVVGAENGHPAVHLGSLSDEVQAGMTYDVANQVLELRGYNNATAVGIGNTGNVGIGTTNPSEKLEVIGNVEATKFIGDGSMLTGINTDDADADQNNELNTSLILNGSDLELTDAGGTLTADLSSLAGGSGDGHSLDAADGDPIDAVLVDNDGNVGIGTVPTSEALLRLRKDQAFSGAIGAGDTTVKLRNDSNTGSAFFELQVGVNADVHAGMRLVHDSATQGDAHLEFRLGTAVQERMRIDKSGNVGIGTITPGHPLEMGSGAHVTAGGVWTNASSRDYKENIRELSEGKALEVLEELEPVHYNYKVDSDEDYLGFIAEDVPEPVATNDRKGLSSMDIVAVLTKVLQTQQKQMRLQQDQIQEQQKKIEELEAWRLKTWQ